MLIPVLILAFIIGFYPCPVADISPPAHPVKLIFIHHSVGENWLADGNGGLGQNLGANNYFVSDTYYGWGPDSIGDRTDIPDWLEWFTGPERETILHSLYTESRGNAAGYDYYSRPMNDPGGENSIIVFKSCFPNSNLAGNPDDPPGDSPDMTVGGAKYVYNQLLHYFKEHPEKLFIAVTPPPEISSQYASQAGAFSKWLTTEWLMDYDGSNVGVFDLHAVLSSPINRHTASSSGVEYVYTFGNTLAYPTDDPHPSSDGNRKATNEFVPLLNYYYNNWIENRGEVSSPSTYEGTSDTGEEKTPDIPEKPEQAILEQIIPAITEPAKPIGNKISGDWVTYDDSESSITLIPGKDLSEFCIRTRVIPLGWASVETLFESPVDWSDYSGISFRITADTSGFPYTVALYSMHPGNDKTRHMTSLQTTAEMVNSGETITVFWSDFTPFDDDIPYNPERSGGLFFAFGSDVEEQGEICISQLILIQ